MIRTSGNLNFIPDEVVNARNKRRAIASEDKIGIVSLFLVAMVGAGIYYYNFLAKQEINTINKDILHEEKTIADLKEFGEKGYQLGVRLSASKDVITSRIPYSSILAQLESRTPADIYVQTVDVITDESMVIDGTSLHNSYSSISDFRQNLLNLPDMFSDVQINSVEHIPEEGLMEFSISVTINWEKTYDKL